MVYKWKIPMKVDAQKIGEELQSIKNVNGDLDPKAVVDRGRNPDSPLHELFEWDDEKAAEKYRLVQAKRIIRNLEVEVEHVEVRAFVKAGNPGYSPIQTVIRDYNMRDVLMKQAQEEMRMFIAKYRSLEELCEVIDAMNAVVAQAS